MKIRMVILGLMVGTIGLAGRVLGSVDQLALAPFNVHWEWDRAVLRGDVVSFVQVSEVPGREAGSLVENFRSVYEFERADGKVALEQEVNPETHEPYWTATFDERERRTRVVSEAMEPGLGVVAATIETARFDGAGNLAGISIDRGPESGEIAIQNQKTAAGKDVSWSWVASQQRKRSFVLSYDGAGRLVHVVLKQDGRVISDGPTVTYNEHGDVSRAESRLGEMVTGADYEYQYDDRGNWTERAEYSIGGQGREKELRCVVKREITYGEGGGGKMAAAVATSRPGDVGVAGKYRAEVGTNTSFHAVMVLEAKGDGTMSLVNTITSAGAEDLNMTSRSLGKWSVVEGKVVVNLETAEDGSAIPEERRLLELVMSEDGKTLTAADGSGLVFRRE
jgi:hypothetical protein